MNDQSWIADGVKCNFLNANGDTIKNIRDYDLHAELKMPLIGLFSFQDF